MATTVASQDEARTEAAMSDEATAVSPGREIVRDIARGGLTGVIIGVVVIGFGGRIAMRAADAPSDAGDRWLDGQREPHRRHHGRWHAQPRHGRAPSSGRWPATCGWSSTPWLPAGGWRRAIVAAATRDRARDGRTHRGQHRRLHPVAPRPGDRRPPARASSACVGLGFSLVDELLERRLPHPAGTRARARSTHSSYSWAPSSSSRSPLAATSGRARPGVYLIGVALVVVGLATATWWGMRLDGRSTRPRALTIVARTALVAAAVAGVAAAIPGVEGALGR